jgi:sec-independent protein translocase protein TatA
MPELIIILVIVLLLFGAKKIPELARGLGSGIKNFKSAIKEDEASQPQKSIEADKQPPAQSASADATKTAA